jgi:8-oxo-dGTP pyrophosphatase MutT (NUDIX family)
MRDVIPEHHLQKKIYNRLVGAESLRYSQLRPEGVEANLFMYHLKELIRSGLVEKVDGGYSLTQQGRSTATRFSIREQGIRIMPSTISVIVLRSKDGEWLLYRRRRQPYIGSLGFPSGKIHLGDSLENAAYRELDEKCGYGKDEVALTWRGAFNLVEHELAGLKNHIIGMVWAGEVKDKRVFENHAGETFWGDWTKENYDDFIPGFREIVSSLNAHRFFGFELRIDDSKEID